MAALPVPRLLPLCSARLELGELRRVDTSTGRGLVGEIVSSRWEGARLTASQLGTGSDWLTHLPDRMATVDVRLHLLTDDNADVLVRYRGRSDTAADHITTSVVFETGAAQYAWLNRIMALGRGRFDVAANVVEYEVYEVC